MPTADCQLATAIFILWLFLPPVSIINLVHMCLMLTEEGGSYELNICALVDLFNKAVAEGARSKTVKTRSEPYDET